MASNEIPRAYAQLIQLAENAADGAQSHGPGVGLAQNTAAKIRTDPATKHIEEITLSYTFYPVEKRAEAR